MYSEAKSASTPMEVNAKLNCTDKANIDVLYQQLLGSLMYLAVNSRPDLAYYVKLIF